MQLKSLAKIQDALNSIRNLGFATEELESIGRSYTTETLKAAIAQSELTKQQIETIMSANGLQGELLETTADELANAASTNAVAASQATTTTTTLGLGTAFKGLGIKIKQATANMWAFLTANPLGWATLAASTIAALAFGVKKYNDSIEEAKESARERTSELFDEFNKMNDTLSDHKKTVSDLADRYDELSRGVNLSNNKNVSLSTEEYEEFLNINSQLANSFPELAKGIDENGNSILTLGTKGITAKEQLEELLQTEEDLNNFRIAQGLEDAFKGVYTYVEDANKATENLNGSINDSSEAMNKLQDIAENGIKLSGDNGQLIFGGDIHNEAELNYMNSLTDSVNEFWKSLDGSRRVELSGFGIDISTLLRTDLNSDTGIFEIYADTYRLTSEEITELENIIQDNVGDASGALLDSISDQSQALQEQIQKGKNAWTDFIPTLVSGMKSKQTFKNLDSDLQDIAIQIVEGLDYSYADAMKEWNPDPYAYVRDKIIDPLSKLDDSGKEKLTSSFEELFKLDAGDLSQDNQEEIEKFITTIATLLEKDPLEIRVALGFDVEDAQNRYNEVLKETKRQFNGYDHDDRGFEVNNAIGNKLDDFWNENVVTEEDWTLWQKVTDGITDATVAMDAYTEAKKNGTEIEIDSEPIFFDQAWEDSFTSENEKVKELGDTLLDLAEKGRLTKEAFKEADSTGYFKNLGISADEAVSKINKLVDESKQLSSMSSQISSMAEALGTKKENGFVDADTLAGFDVEVRGLESWDKFQSVLGSTTSSYEECKDAANALATEWVNSSDFLAQLTEDTKEYYETQLEDMGVENYEEVIESTLALKEAKEALMDVDLSDATVEDIENLIQEGKYTGIVTEQIWALYTAKLAEQATAIDSSSDCQQFLNLANNANLTAESIRLLTELMNIYDGLESGVYDKNAVARTGALAAASSIKAQIEKLASGEGITVKPEVKVDGSKGKKSGGGSGSSKDAWKEVYDAELKELEHMHEMGLLSDAEYWQARLDLNEKYFGESSGMHEKYLDEYQDNEEDILEGLKKLWEDYYDERKNNLKDLISYAEKLYDKEIDSHEATIKKLEERRDAEKLVWQGQIDDIDDEIDALEDANDERERAIDIQQKQLALQKAMHQRTILIYSSEKGMHYVADDKAVRDSKNNLDDAEHDNKVADLKKQQDDLQKQLDIILETYDTQIESIEKQIDSLKQVKSAWSDIVDNQELKELEERLRSLFGDDIKSKILSGNTDFINSIISQYSDTSDMLRTIEDAALADIQNMAAQYGVLPENLMPVSGMITDIANTLGNVDTSGFNANLDSTAQSSSNAAAQIQGTANAINTLSNEVSNYQMPELNADNITASLSEDGAVLTALKGFTERFKEICEEIQVSGILL